MKKRILVHDDPTRFYLIIARMLGFLFTGGFLLFMLLEFLNLSDGDPESNIPWQLVFNSLSIAYGLGFLLSFWKLALGGFLLLISSILICFFAFIDSESFIVFLLLTPISFSRILFLTFWWKNRSRFKT
ncbi:hypothetical protein [Labilibaculum sp.]|uniref:hypothetical protein n=1 Tax=Labilibaculum sp. TaxID=2060723 RepID=UPI003561F9AE